MNRELAGDMRESPLDALDHAGSKRTNAVVRQVTRHRLTRAKHAR
jgi:hypothetical protein